MEEGKQLEDVICKSIHSEDRSSSDEEYGDNPFQDADSP